MKTLFIFLGGILLLMLIFTQCKKNETPDSGGQIVAHAGEDQSIVVSSCDQSLRQFRLNGSSSTSTQGYPMYYHWSQIKGPTGVTIDHANSARTDVFFQSLGEYWFELTVNDGNYHNAKDTLVVLAGGSSKTFDFESTVEEPFTYTDNFEDCYYGCSYYDGTWVNAVMKVSPTDDVTMYLEERADTANTSTNHDTRVVFNFAYPSSNLGSAFGNCSVNFKEIIGRGGGDFSGSITLYDGTGKTCDETIFNSLGQLKVTGNINVVTGRISMSIKGKLLF